MPPLRPSQTLCRLTIMGKGETSDPVDAVACCLIEYAARRTPTALSERMLEEWLADLAGQRGRMARLKFALGCYRAAILIQQDCGAAAIPAASAPGLRIMTAASPCRMSPFTRPAAPTGNGSVPVICEINTTPLIDVLLVLLVTLIITLPLMTQSVRLDLPQAHSSDQAPLEVINLDIDFDGTVAWNGSPVASFEQLEGYLRAEGRKHPQPEIHLRPDAYVKYDVVAKVLAAAQRNRLTKVGFVNSAEFAN